MSNNNSLIPSLPVLSSSIGIMSRLNRLTSASPGLVFALDDRLTGGPTGLLFNLDKLADAVAATPCRAVMGFPGTLVPLARRFSPGSLALIMNLNAGTILQGALVRKSVLTIEQALELDAVAVCFHIDIGSPEEPGQLRELALHVRHGSQLGIPIMAAAYPRADHQNIDSSPEKVIHAANVAYELGATLIKFPFTTDEELLADLRDSIPQPTKLLMAGGEPTDPETLLRGARGVVHNNIDGICVGRSFFQVPDSTTSMVALYQELNP